MKKILLIFIFTLPFLSLGQNVQVDSQTYSSQELIEDILIDSNCIENVIVTNVIGGDFDNTDQSYGYFDANGSSFPFSSGIVLSTGKLQHVPGPNNSLSDDDANNWTGDDDLEQILNETNTHNATIIEFEFTAIADQISFRYIFASEEYQENNSNTCQYSDLFGFLIRPINDQQYTNIAVVPNTNIPVKVTTVHPEIPGSCEAENEAYFGSWNSDTAPINFNGQTQILTATANVNPNETYHVKLVIADEQNYRYDSAVFLEAGSFKLTTDLGPDRIIATNNPLCENEPFQINALQSNATTYKWFKNDTELTSELNPYLNILDNGIYNVEVTLSNSCISYGEIAIEFSTNPIVFDTSLNTCDNNQDLLTVFNLWDASQDIINNDDTLQITNFFTSFNDALQNTNPILEPSYFENTNPFQTVFARVENYYGCFSISEVQLIASYNPFYLEPFSACDDIIVDGVTDFNLSQLYTDIQNSSPQDAEISFYESIEDVYTNNLITISNYQNSIPYTQTLFVKITVNNQCFALTTVDIEVLYTPLLEEDITNDNPIIYCLNTYPETITLYGGVINDSPSNYYYSWSTGENMSFIDINEPGVYSVTVTDPNGCSSSRNITVVGSNIATITDVLIEELSLNNSITVIASGEGDYEYALDNSFYQDSNLFENVSTGFHTVYVRDKHSCGITSQEVAVLGFPKYFTPNGDSFNEFWQVDGVNQNFNQGIIVTIFNRYGKLITSISHQTAGWDGSLNGYDLPSDDYWFIAKFPNGKEYRGHFALIR